MIKLEAKSNAAFNSNSTMLEKYKCSTYIENAMKKSMNVPTDN